MKVPRRIVRSVLAVTGLGVAFLFMASIIVPERSEAGGETFPPPVPNPYSAEVIEAVQPMGQIEGNLYTVGFFATPTGPLFTVYDRHGNELAPLLTASQLAQQFPDLAPMGTHADVPMSLIGTDIGGRN
ncbi:MAG: hypothetical protein ACYS15_04530 [Planctomycetota bacterium]|jgi:hypothetical protein